MTVVTANSIDVLERLPIGDLLQLYDDVCETLEQMRGPDPEEGEET